MPRRRSRRTELAAIACCAGGLVAVPAHAQAQNAAQQRTSASTASTENRRQPAPTPPPVRPVHNDGAFQTASLMQKSGGSLFRASLAAQPDPSQARYRDTSYFAVPEPEPKTIRKHDLVTIIIREESTFSSQGTTDTKRESDLEAKIEETIKLKLGNFAIQGGAQGASPPSIKASANRSFKANGQVDRSDTFSARITGEVLDVKPNGTLVIQARKQIKTDEEEQQFILTGTCRVEDINADNTVLSTQMYDLRLEKNAKGAVRSAVKRGLIHQVFDFLNPF